MKLLVLHSVAAIFLTPSLMFGEDSTFKTGDTTVIYQGSGKWITKPLDTPPGPVGGRASLASKLSYPPNLRHISHMVQGASVVSVLIERNGKVASISFSPRMNQALEDVVVQAVRGCQWRPATKGKVSFRSIYRMSIRFEVHGWR